MVNASGESSETVMDNVFSVRLAEIIYEGNVRSIDRFLNMLGPRRSTRNFGGEL